MEGDPIGRISKQWGGLLREMFVDADYFGITFPMDLDVKLKAVMLGACFLIVSVLVILHLPHTDIFVYSFKGRHVL